MAQFYTLEEAARVLGMSPEELKTKAQAREIRAFHGRRHLAVPRRRHRRAGPPPRHGQRPRPLALRPRPGCAPSGGSDSGADIDLSEFQLGVATPDLAAPSAEMRPADQDVLLDDTSVPPEPTGSSSDDHRHEARRASSPATPTSGSCPRTPPKGAGDSDVRLATPAAPGPATPT